MKIFTKRLNLTLLAFAAALTFFLAPKPAEAAETLNYNSYGNMIVHSQQPHITDQPGSTPDAVTAHTTNVSGMGFTTTVCAEEMANGVKRHLGCIPTVPYQSMQASQAESSFSFNVWPSYTQGERAMIFSYRDPQGGWHQIPNSNLSQNHTVVNVM